MNKQKGLWAFWCCSFLMVAGSLLYPLYGFLQGIVDEFYVEGTVVLPVAFSSKFDLQPSAVEGHFNIFLPSACLLLSVIAWMVVYNRVLGFILLMLYALAMQIGALMYFKHLGGSIGPEHFWWPVGIAVSVIANCIAWAWLKDAKAGELEEEVPKEGIEVPKEGIMGEVEPPPEEEG